MSRSLPDPIFYPLIAMLAGGMIFLAMEPFKERKPSGPLSAGAANALDLSVSGDELYRFRAGRVGEITLQADDGATHLTVLLSPEEKYDTPLYGPHLVLDSDLERNYEGRKIRVTVEAKRAPEAPSSGMEINYSAGSLGESGWHSFDLKSEFTSHSLEYDVPFADSSLGRDYLAIRPQVHAKFTSGIEIRSIRFEGLGNKRPRN